LGLKRNGYEASTRPLFHLVPFILPDSSNGSLHLDWIRSEAEKLTNSVEYPTLLDFDGPIGFAGSSHVLLVLT